MNQDFSVPQGLSPSFGERQANSRGQRPVPTRIGGSGRP